MSVSADAAIVPEGRLWRLLRILVWTVVALYFAFAGVTLALRYLILPNIGEQRGRIEALASEAIGRPVTIGSLTADWSGLRPRLHLRQVAVADEAGQPALQLDQVDAVLGWSSLLRLRPFFRSIEVEGPRLMLRREADGSLWVAGLPVDRQSKEPGFADWLLAQGVVTVRNARLEWTDVLRGAPTLVLDDLQLQVRNGLGRHRFGLQARLPEGLAPAIDLRGDLRGRGLAGLMDGSGTLYGRVDRADLGAFRPWVDLPYGAAGRGSARAWLELDEGRLASLVADADLADARLRLAPELPELDLSAAAGRLRLEQANGARGLELDGVRLATRDGVVIPPTDLRLELRQDKDPGGRFRANQLDLGALARLAAHLPLAPEVVDRLATFVPAGVIRGAELEWHGPRDALSAWKLKAGFEGIGLRAWKSIPGVRGLTGEVAGSEESGRIRVLSRDLTVDLPEVFSNPRLELANVRAEAGWQRRGAGIEYSLDKAEFDNQDASGQASGTYVPSDSGPGVIDLSARLSRAKGPAVWRYMPLVVNRDTREWLQRSIVGGTAHDARLRLKGDLANFPFVGGKGGQFQVKARIAGARLEYAEGWPAIDGIDGELLFEGATMTISADRGRIFGAQLSGVTATLPDLESFDEIIQIKGRAVGPTPDFLRFVSESPVAEQIDHFTDEMTAEGSGTLDLELAMPLRRTADTAVKGEFRFAGNRLGVVPRLPPVTEAGGRLTFTAKSLTVPEARGRLFGEPVHISGRTRSDGSVLFEASGGVTPAAAAQTWGWPWLAHLAGQAPWRSEITVRGRGAAVVVESSLQGLSSSLPPPLNKSATESWPLRVELDIQPAGAGDRIRATLGSVAALELEARGSGADWKVSRGDVAVRLPVTLPDKGLTFHAGLAELDLDAWRRIARETGATAAAPPAPGAPPGLAQVSVQAGKVLAAGETFHDFSLQASARSDGWQGSLKSREAEGDFRWQSKDEGTLTARLSRLAMGGGKEGLEAEAGGEAEATRSLPALDVAIQQFVLRDKPLGRLAVVARNQGGDWHLDSLSLTNPDGGFTGKALWHPGRDGRTQLDFKVETGDVGKFLARLGFGDAIRRGTATLEGKVQWAGPPTAIDYPSLAGDMELTAENGQFQKLEPGVGRLLGVLSLQSLPRRITLDFRDVFSEGFAFDRISGSIDVKAGVLHTDDLQIRGPAARVMLKGTADVARETQDMLVTVQPTLSESLAVGATLVNPVAGVVTYLAQKVLSDPFERLFSFDYRITGQWQDPKVEKLSTRPPAAEGAPK